MRLRCVRGPETVDLGRSSPLSSLIVRYPGKMICKAGLAADYWGLVHWSTQALTVLYQSSLFWGLRTQWPSSGK